MTIAYAVRIARIVERFSNTEQGWAPLLLTPSTDYAHRSFIPVPPRTRSTCSAPHMPTLEAHVDLMTYLRPELAPAILS
jgi:hypothetical protein